MKINKITLSVLIVFGVMLGGVGKVESANISSPTYNIPLCGTGKKNCNTANALHITGDFTGNIAVTFYKTFNFVLDGGYTGTWFELPVNKVVTVKNENTTGAWFISGSGNDSPAADGNWYSFLQSQVFYTGVSTPADYVWPSITSSDSSIVECNGGGCIGRKPGTAYITVSFPSAYRNLAYPTPNTNSGFGAVYVSKSQWQQNSSGNWAWVNGSVGQTYNFDPITYGVVVPALPNTSQSTSCSVGNIITSGINTSAATINWNYSDTENDAQTNYHIQIATSPTFEDASVVDQAAQSFGNTPNARSYTTNTLKPDTQYYARAATYNNINKWGNGFVNCGAGFRTPPPPKDGICGTEVSNTCGSNGELEGVYGGENISTTWWSCPGSNGGATLSCSLPKNTSNGLSCTVSDKTPYINQNVTYTALFNPAADVKKYDWYIGGSASGPSVGNSNTYLTNYSATDLSRNSYLRTIKITKQDDSFVTMTCPLVSVGCDPSTKTIRGEVCTQGKSDITVSVCSSTGWVTTTKSCQTPGNSTIPTGTFNFNPKIVNAGDTCPLFMNIQKVTSCILNNKFDTPTTILADPITHTIIKNGSDRWRVGTYDLSCVGLGDPLPNTVHLGTQSCYSKPEIKES